MVRQTLVNGNDPRAEGSITRIKVSSNNDTFLHYAPNAKMVQFLIDKGADVHAKTYSGEDALIRMIYSNQNIELIKTLLKNGASLSATNNNGETPLEIVEKQLEIAIEYKQSALIGQLQALREFLKSYSRNRSRD